MTNQPNLFLFEAVQYRTVYDCQITAIEGLLGKRQEKNGRMRMFEEPEERVPAEGFDASSLQAQLKSLRAKRMILNREIQKVNLTAEFAFEGDHICIADALELRKSFVEELKMLKENLNKAAYSSVIHKEKRDIVVKPEHSFPDVYKRFNELLEKQRHLEALIHNANHSIQVGFRPE